VLNRTGASSRLILRTTRSFADPAPPLSPHSARQRYADHVYCKCVPFHTFSPKNNKRMKIAKRIATSIEKA
jgi:hypothetical protein